MGEYADGAVEAFFDFAYQVPNAAVPWRGRRRRPVIAVDAETRLLRMQAHRSFDRIWKERRMSRTEAYEWLAGELGAKEPGTEELGMSPSEAHMGRMTDHGLLRKVVEVCDSLMGTTVAQDDFDGIED